MGVLKYDTVNGAFKDIQAMQKFDTSANAWKDCTSAKVIENGVWVEKLEIKLDFADPNLWRINNQGNVTSATISKQGDGILFSVNSSDVPNSWARAILLKEIDFSKYSKVIIDYTATESIYYGNNILIVDNITGSEGSGYIKSLGKETDISNVNSVGYLAIEIGGYTGGRMTINSIVLK